MPSNIHDVATNTLKKHGDVEKALPEFVRTVRAKNLIDDLAREFLRTITAGRESGHQGPEPQASSAGFALATNPKGSIKVRAHDVHVHAHRRRTQAQKEAAERALMASAEAVFELQIEGRAIGSIAIGELASLKHELVDDASHKLMLGAEQVRNAVLAELIEQHCKVTDQLARVREVVSAKVLTRLVEQAEQEAPRRIAEAMRRAAQAIEHKEIVA